MNRKGEKAPKITSIIKNEIISTFTKVLLWAATSFIVFKLGKIPLQMKKRQEDKHWCQWLENIGVKDISISLDMYEKKWLPNIVSNLDTTWNSIGGLDELIKDIKFNVLMPMTNADLKLYSSLLQSPKGILLYGPPGCGKTMVAKAVSTEAGARFINADLSQITNKWYGESQKMVSALFSLAEKLQPSIIFVDEIDALLGTRNFHDTETTTQVKALFMQLWDGLLTKDNSNAVCVMGATNRKDAIDAAILRRMPVSVYVGLPNEDQREEIFKKILIKENLDIGVELRVLAKETQGFSGAKIKEVCRMAAVERMKRQLEPSSPVKIETGYQINICHGISQLDFLTAIRKIQKSFASIMPPQGMYL